MIFHFEVVPVWLPVGIVLIGALVMAMLALRRRRRSKQQIAMGIASKRRSFEWKLWNLLSGHKKQKLLTHSPSNRDSSSPVKNAETCRKAEVLADLK